ncbi:MAG: hypothetical protein UY50_C0027G0032 [Parcubacteria group bacterium GW2011_GWA2_49_9]|nr:MAG: hypothetical protein UY50_C0027G0032 [Parcubacteria group bacterium GW2011_GWA2_49_9]
MQKYTVNQCFVSNILNWVQEREIAIPEIQRPFVWDSVKVRDLMDSLYKGFPIGYIIAWKNPDVRLKDGTISKGKKVLIDGQQRITALRAAMLGENIISKDYKEERIKIAFNPLASDTEQIFDTWTPAIAKNPIWIPDISNALKTENALFDIEDNYCERNSGVDRRIIRERLKRLSGIKQTQVGFIELDSDLDIEEVTSIFIRINKSGVSLSQADFAMSKIASYDKEDNFGVNLRKCIDYFCHLSREPQFYKHISENDTEFKNTIYLSKIAWLKNENDDLYDPDYSDVLRVSFTKQFERGKMADLVSLLSGRNFETRSFEQDIVNKSFQELRDSVLEFVSETNFKDFLMAIKSAGFTSKDLISSRGALNFAYILFLKLREKGVNRDSIKRIIAKWFVMSLLTERYSGSPESQFDFDIKQISKDGAEKILQSIENAQLSDAYWNAQLIQELDKASVSNPFLNLFFAAQIKANDKGFLSTDITVGNMVDQRGDIHHLFPREYLKANGLQRGDYNQIANFAYAQSEINIKVGKKSPKEYMVEVIKQTKGGELKYGGIVDKEILAENLKQNCIPTGFEEMELGHYENFLNERRKLMAQKIKEYYFSL